MQSHRSFKGRFRAVRQFVSRVARFGGGSFFVVALLSKTAECRRSGDDEKKKEKKKKEARTPPCPSPVLSKTFFPFSQTPDNGPFFAFSYHPHAHAA